MPSFYLPHGFVRALLVAALLLTSLAPAAVAQEDIYLPLITNGQPPQDLPPTDLLYRTHVNVHTPAAWHDLSALGVVTLQRGADWALLLVDEEQLATLARLRYEPTATNALETLAAADAQLQRALAPVLSALATLQAELTSAQVATDAHGQATVRQSLRATMHALSATDRHALARATAVDSDGDGLTDDQEGWWCTDASKRDSDFDGTDDGAEVAALSDWLGNRRASFPSTGKPFQGWPSQKANCYDDDQDAVPDLAESLFLGLNPNRESTDRDKFDDGQELFGLTYCTGQGGFCSYGPLPRNEDWGVIFAEMPSWVKAPGNHPLVAAFPVPEVDVVQSSLKVETVTVVTTDHVISEGTEKSYSTAKMEGTSSSVANTETWNEWQEISESMQERDLIVAAAHLSNEPSRCWFSSWGNEERKSRCLEAKKYYEAKQVAEDGCKFKVGQGWTVGGDLGLEYKKVSLGLSTEYDFGKTQFSEVLTDNRCLASLRRAHQIGSGQFNENYPLPESQINEQNTYHTVNNSYETINFDTRQNNVLLNHNFDTDSIVTGLEGLQFTYAQTGELIADSLFGISQVLAAPVRTATSTSGQSQGGSKTTTHTEYEEHTVTNGEAFSTGEAWGTATAVNSAHAADLTFSYRVRNTGTEYAREIANLVFNLYIGDDPNPAYTYFVAPDLGGNGKFENFMPSEEHPYTSRRIPLSLEQMKAIDLGGPLRIVVEDFTYGIDELFYRDAANAGVLIALEDGTDDGDESIDTYLIPTWGEETVLNVLARYFPHATDANGMLTAIWTPEYRSDQPGWCRSPRRPTDQPNKALWCKHELSTADWWNIYTDGLGDGSEGFQSARATPGATALFRFNKDTDLDGFSDRSEARLGTDAADAASFPRPELLAGLHQIVDGDRVTATLSLLNTGIYDAYGVEAVMVAPDDSITIENNTVGGSGRVRALQQVIVGSRVRLPQLANTPWNGENSHAVPAVGGYYTGSTDRTYSFTANCAAGSCAVGSGTWTMAWNDGRGQQGEIAFGAGYASPTFLPVGELGVTLALHSGTVGNGESFAVQANTPRDTFQYTINREPFTEPLVIVSYNDPQGNHRFVLPPAAMQLSAPTENLQTFAGTMRADVGVALVTTAAFDATQDPQGSLTLLVNNPSDTTLHDAHLFLEFINISGTVVAEVPTQVTLPPGPTGTTVSFDSRTFDPPHKATEDYIVLAFLTDQQGNILDTAGRPLSSFQMDPLPELATDAATLTWDFGTAARGTLLHHRLALANQGHGRLYTYLPPTAGLALVGTGQRTVGAADTGDHRLQLDTLALPAGPYNNTVTLRTNDGDLPALTLTVQGTIAAETPDIPASTLQRPLDVAVLVTGTHSQGEWIEQTHDLGSDPATLHPVKIYSSDYENLWGVGKVATNFSDNTASADMFGDGRDGDLVVTSGETKYTDDVRTVLSNSAASGEITICVASTNGLRIGDKILIVQIQGTGAGNYEFATIQAISTCWLTLNRPLLKTFTTPNSNAQVLRISQYRNVTVESGGTLTAHMWDGSTGGIVAFQSSGETVISTGGTVNMNGKGFRGGERRLNNNPDRGQNGEGYLGYYNATDIDCWGQNNSRGNGGGAGHGYVWVWESHKHASGGGGGGNGSDGGNGKSPSYDGWCVGSGAKSVGNHTLATIFFGGGGASGGAGKNDSKDGGAGGDGGGIVFLSARSLSVSGSIESIGTKGENASGSGHHLAGGGGGGAGGSIFIQTQSLANGSTNISAIRGNGGLGNAQAAGGGTGGDGRIRIEYCETLTGTTNPPASTQKLDCYSTEQTAPSTFRLNLPAAVNGTATYQVQFGRKLDFAAAGEQVTTLRVPVGMVSSAYLDALVSGLPASAGLTLDVGNDGSVEFDETVANNSANQSDNLAAAVTAYWQSQGSPLTGTIDLPIKVGLSQPGQLLLTNLRVQTVGSQLRRLRLPAEHNERFILDFALANAGSVALDLGDDGSIDWHGTATTARQRTGNLADPLNAYLSDKDGAVDLPLRFYVDPAATVTLNQYTASLERSADLVAQSIQLGAVTSQVQASMAGELSTGELNAGDRVQVAATLQNSGNLASGPLTAAFFAEAEGWGDWYLGSAFIEDLQPGAATTVETEWNTTGFSGTVPVKVVVNPYGRIPESDYANNARATAATVHLVVNGDINADRALNIFDLQRLITMILHETQPDASRYPLAHWNRGDLTGDGRWNVFDLQRLINLIQAQQE